LDDYWRPRVEQSRGELIKTRSDRSIEQIFNGGGRKTDCSQLSLTLRVSRLDVIIFDGLLVKVRNVIVESTSLEEKLLATGLSTSASASVFEGVFFSSHFPELISVESLFASLDDAT
jgi:hypothetical protein